MRSHLFGMYVFSDSKEKLSEYLTDDGSWRAEVVLDRYKDLQDPVLGWFIMQHLISRIILLVFNTWKLFLA
jgi:hypothetical protein